MHEPSSGLARLPDHVVTLARRDIDRLRQLHVDRVRGGVGAAVDGKGVGLHVVHRHGGKRMTVALQSFLELHDGFVVGRHLVGQYCGVDDQGTVIQRTRSLVRGSKNNISLPTVSPIRRNFLSGVNAM